MIKIDLQLESDFLAAMFKQVKLTADSVSRSLVIESGVSREDEDLKSAWEASLMESLKSDCDFLLSLLQHHHFGDCELKVDQDVAESVLRAASAVRLKMAQTVLASLSQEQLEDGSVEILSLPSDQLICYSAYRFLAYLQGLIIREIDPFFEEA